MNDIEFEIEYNAMTGEQKLFIKLDGEMKFLKINTKWLIGAIRTARAAKARDAK